MKRLLTAILIVVMMVPLLPINGSSVSVSDANIQIGKVIEVIDGEVVKISLYHQNFNVPTIKTVKAIGLRTEASNEAFNYANNRLLGETVFLLEEASFQDSPYMEANIFVSFNQTYTEEVIERGYGKVDTHYEGSEFYDDFLSSEAYAQLYEIGVWETALSERTDRININTASHTLLMNILGLSTSQAMDVIVYRRENIYNSIIEIMAANDQLDAEWMDANRHLISVITNMNQTSYLELASLLPYGEDEEKVIDQIDYYLRFNEVEEIDDLYDVDGFSRYIYSLDGFITLEAMNRVEEANKATVNVNTVGEELFTAVTNLTTNDYKVLALKRKDGYVITSLKELYVLDHVYAEANNYIYGNHLTTFTDMNHAGETELLSLLNATDLPVAAQLQLVDKLIEAMPFKSLEEVKRLINDNETYDQIDDYIYVNQDDIVDRYNPNTAKEDDLNSLKADYKGHYTNYTNINTASEQMLLDLNEAMTQDLVDDIIDYRRKYPFRNNNDLANLFEDHEKTLLYSQLAKFMAYE